MADFHNHSRDTQPEYEDFTKPVLYNGIGTPYLAIFTGDGDPIMDELNDLPIGMEVESFNYKYTEGKGDSGKFVIVTNNPGIVDHPNLQFKMPLLLQWGWLLPNTQEGAEFKCSPPRLVNIKGHEISFTPQGTKFTIEFADGKMFLEAEPSQYVYNETKHLEFFGALAGGRMNVVVKVFDTKPGNKLVTLMKDPCSKDARDQQEGR